LRDDEEQPKIEDMKAVESARSALEKVPHMSTGPQTVVLLGGEQDISQLGTIRETHQTKRAARSTKTCKAQANDPTLPAPLTASQRNQICSQMADVIRRSGTGLERNTRWISGSAPGTKDPTEVSQLSGNSANAEISAKERVDTVCDLLPLSLNRFSYFDTHRPLDCGQDSLITSLFTSQGIWLTGS